MVLFRSSLFPAGSGANSLNPKALLNHMNSGQYQPYVGTFMGGHRGPFLLLSSEVLT